MKKLLILLAIIVICCGSASAVDVEESQYNALELDRVEGAVPGGASDLMDGLRLTDSLDPDKGINTIISNSGREVSGIIRKGLQSAAIMMAVLILCGVINGMYGENASVPNYVPLVGVLAVSAVAVSDVRSFLGMGSEMLTQMDIFSKALLPSLSAAAAASGAITAAGAKYAATALFLNVLMTVSTRVIIPVIYAYLAASIANAAMGGEALSGAASLLKWAATSLLTIIILAFVAYIGITGVISGTADAVTTRIAKTAISTALPVVGGIISDAAGAIVSGASFLRNAVGVFGMLAVAAICIVPFLSLGVHYLLYKLVSGASLVFSESRLSKLVGNIGSAFGMILGMTGSCAIMLFFSIITTIQAVTP